MKRPPSGGLFAGRPKAFLLDAFLPRVFPFLVSALAMGDGDGCVDLIVASAPPGPVNAKGPHCCGPWYFWW
jgi:hypothetical protein